MEDEVEDANGIDGLQIVVPSTLLRLFTDWESGIEDGTLLEKILLGLLHLDDELLAAAAFAIDIENGPAVGVERANPFIFQKGDGLELALLIAEKLVQEIHEDVLVRLLSEEFFETEVGEWVYELAWHEESPVKTIEIAIPNHSHPTG